MATTVLIEPDPGGHRFQAVANVANVAARTDDVLLLTSAGATSEPAFQAFLGDLDLQVEEVFDTIYPPTAVMAAAAADVCRAREVSTLVVMDADITLKRWWYVAPRAFRGVRRPRVVFFVTRYPAKLRLTDLPSWKLRLAKGTLAAAAMATGSLHRAAGFAGRDDMSTGWIVKRTRDPEICTAHSRDRQALRAELGLPADRRIAGIFGLLERKNVPLVWEAMTRRGIDADLLLAGTFTDDLRAWVAAQPPYEHGRILVKDGFLSNEDLDKYVAASDVLPLALDLNGPSGIMGKALVAEVPVLAAGSEVVAREVRALDAGEVADGLDPDSIGAAFERFLARDPGAPRRSTIPPATAEEFGETVLGVGAAARGRGRRRGRR
jgi:glycosyltransferase involved in cell wall biosynthesis